MNFSKVTKFLDKSSPIPNHVAIIMDGNGRWAKRNMVERLKGHEQGAHALRKIVKSCCKIGIPILTLYTFSTENWKRPKIEVDGLMRILVKFLKLEQEFLFKNNVFLNTIGQTYKLPLIVRKTLSSVIDKTSKNNGLKLNLALSYGGRSEILDAVLRIASEVKNNIMNIDSIDCELFSRYLSTDGLPDPDVLIRTGGEMRLSNFLLWQLAYTEIFFTKTLWPDFSTEEFNQIIRDFPKRNRRFGSILA